MRKPPKADNRKSTHNTTPLNNINLLIFFFFSFWALSFLSVFHFFFLKKKLLGIQKQRGPVAQTCLYSGYNRSLKPFHSNTRRDQNQERALSFCFQNLRLCCCAKDVGGSECVCFVSQPIRYKKHTQKNIPTVSGHKIPVPVQLYSLFRMTILPFY